MGKTKKARGRPFRKDDGDDKDDRISLRGRPPVDSINIGPPTRFREPQSVYDQISFTKFQGGVPFTVFLWGLKA